MFILIVTFIFYTSPKTILNINIERVETLEECVKLAKTFEPIVPSKTKDGKSFYTCKKEEK